MKHPLKRVVREHFELRSLPPERMELFEKLFEEKSPRRAPSWRRSCLRYAGVAAALLVPLLVMLPFVNAPVDRGQMLERIALEVARNHIKLNPMDVTTDEMEDIRRYFTGLEFAPLESALLIGSGLELIGGRYCSIQSVPAAQLRLTRPGDDKPQTLYQTEYKEDIFGPLPVLEDGDAPVTVNVKGVSVRIWVEKGLLIALARSGGPDPIAAPE